MAWHWLSKKTSGGDKMLQKARKLCDQRRWAEALSFYEEALEGDPESEEASRGARACREQLVEWNLEEARSYAQADEPEKALEHANLAVELAENIQDLKERAKAVRATLHAPAPTNLSEPPERLFPPSCPRAAAHAQGEAITEPTVVGGDTNPGELFELYLGSLSPLERKALEPLGDAFRSGFVLLQQGETESARPLLEECARETPDAAGVHYSLGLLTGLEGDPSGATTHYARALDCDAGFAPAAHHRAQALRDANRLTEATSFLEEWLDGNPEDGDAWLLLAACRMDAHDPDRALDAVHAAEKWKEEGEVATALLKARIERERGETDAALECLQALVARSPDLLDALIPLGQLLVEKGGGSAERAAEVFKRCYRLDPDRGWWHLIRVAEAYARRGWKAEAREVLHTAQQQLPDASGARAEWQAVSRLVED